MRASTVVFGAICLLLPLVVAQDVARRLFVLVWVLGVLELLGGGEVVLHFSHVPAFQSLRNADPRLSRFLTIRSGMLCHVWDLFVATVAAPSQLEGERQSPLVRGGGSMPMGGVPSRLAAERPRLQCDGTDFAHHGVRLPRSYPVADLPRAP